MYQVINVSGTSSLVGSVKARLDVAAGNKDEFCLQFDTQQGYHTIYIFINKAQLDALRYQAELAARRWTDGGA